MLPLIKAAAGYKHLIKKFELANVIIRCAGRKFILGGDWLILGIQQLSDLDDIFPYSVQFLPRYGLPKC